MNLKSRFWLGSAALVTPLLFMGGLWIWNLMVQSRAMGAASAEFEFSDRARAAVVQAGWLRDSLRGTRGETFYDVKYLTPIQVEASRILQGVHMAAKVDDGDAAAERRLAEEIPAQLQKAADQFADKTPTASSTAAAANHLEELMHSLTMAGALGPDAARRHVIVAQASVAAHTTWALMWFCVVLVFSAAVHYKQYRVLVRPLVRLRDDMRRSASSEYRAPVQLPGDAEFREVAVYFNGLARELADLYRSLEEKVIARSRELVRSERLASVGFLAAGVAHEINNPLSVISGYAELSTKNLRHVLIGPGELGGNSGEEEGESSEMSAKAEAEGSFRACWTLSESFGRRRFGARKSRDGCCRWARRGSDCRELLNLHSVAEQVSVLVKGLRNYRDRRIVLAFDTPAATEVVANATEMKQVLLNLTVNALEASPAQSGEVRIGGRRCGEWVECYVQDNGKGMMGEVLDQIFEPFFTAKRGAGEPGTGLGLSITHAIIENHGGSIRAESDGPGHGSRFTFRLPAGSPAVAGKPRAALVNG